MCSFAGSHYFISTKLLKQINKRISSKKLQAGLIASSAVPLYVGNRLFNNAYSRHREALADENVPQQKEYLEGACTLFEKFYKLDKVLIADSFMHDMYTSRSAYFWYATHPTNEMRLKRFQERLALLEKNKPA